MSWRCAPRSLTRREEKGSGLRESLPLNSCCSPETGEAMTVEIREPREVLHGGACLFAAAGYSCRAALLVAALALPVHAQSSRAASPAIERYFRLARAEYSGERARELVVYMGGWFRWPGNTAFDASIDRVVSCLLYTSDAADDLLCVDLGGRRII